MNCGLQTAEMFVQALNTNIPNPLASFSLYTICTVPKVAVPHLTTKLSLME